MQVGDYLLIELARILQEFTQNESDSVLYRIGPDEFAIVYEKKEVAYVLNKANAVLHLIENSEIYYDDIKIPVTVNIGIANKSPHLLNAQRCIRELHHTFGEKIKVYNESMNDIEQIKRNIETVQKVKEAMVQDKIIPYFQPIVDAKSGEINKYETLMRIEQDGEVLSPYLFLDITKKVKLYNAISHRIIEKSIKTIKQNGVEIAINISIEDILESKNSRFIYDLLKNNETIAPKITFEIVESEQIRDYGRLMEFIEIVKSYGCKIAIDDFGSGYSNFDYLFNFDVDFLKIDGSLIKNIDTDERSFMIVKTIVAFAKEAQIQTVAEFVHSQEIATIVKEIGIDYAQGYFYGKPTKI
jgi:EAL domain-containing protein (putative c-di-GMP-specific phosphodiesterase class I)